MLVVAERKITGVLLLGVVRVVSVVVDRLWVLARLIQAVAVRADNKIQGQVMVVPVL
jgi:hypothetical protein